MSNEYCGCKSNERHVEIYFIRHGFSCANAKKAYGLFHQKISRFKEYDPQLTSYAQEQIRRLQPQLSKQGFSPDIVFSSVLLRAIQTAHNLFPYNNVYVAPYIKELGFTYDNTPIIPEEQMVKINDNKKIRYDFVYSKNRKRGLAKWKKAQEIDYSKFLDWLANTAIPTIEKIDENLQRKRGKLLRIAVVTHGHFMKKYLPNVANDKPNNVSIAKINYCMKSIHKLVITNQIECQCLGIDSFKNPKKSENRYCNRMIFGGFPKPNKDIFNQFEERCPI